MSPHDEEDYELVLGNRQLFFLAVVLFGVFFSIGYTVGYSRGHNTSEEVAANHTPATAPETPAVPAVEPTGDAPAKSTEAVYSTAPGAGKAASPKPVEASAQPASPPASNSPTSAAANREPPARGTAPATLAKAAAASTASSATRPSSAAVRGTPSKAASAATSAAGSPGTPPAASADTARTVAVPAIQSDTIYLQVLASREAEPARKALLEFKSKGHPVTLDNRDPDWYRIIVGPFDTREAADAYQARLQAEGVKSFLRKF